MSPRARTTLAALAAVAVASGVAVALADKDRALVGLALTVLPLGWGALTGVVVWWLRGRNAVEVTPAGAAAAADWLAGEVSARWSLEAAARHIVTPAPASVRWRWAASDLSVPRQEAILPVVPGAGPLPLPLPLPDLGQAGEILGSGVVTRLHDEVYARLPRGRLVLVGGPGAGKTGAMVLLLLAALDARACLGEEARLRVPVPVWLTLGGWDPAAESVLDWVTGVLNRDYPALRSPEYGTRAAGHLVRNGRAALFLDGLDEMPAELRAAALRRLNVEAGGLRIVITSRPDEYRLAVRGAGLDSVAVIELRPVRPEAAAAYLLRGQTGPGRGGWEQVGDYLRDNPGSVAARTLNNPLTLSLAREAYAIGDPAVMTSSSNFPSEVLLTRHLIEQFLVTAYPDERSRAYAIRWLSWIAWRMGDSEDLRWWDVPGWIAQWRLRLARGVVTGLTAGVLVTVMALVTYAHLVAGFAPTGIRPRLAPGVAAGIGLGLIAGLAARLAPRSPGAAAPDKAGKQPGRFPALAWLAAGAVASALTLAAGTGKILIPYTPSEVVGACGPLFVAFFLFQARRSWRDKGAARIPLLETPAARTVAVCVAIGAAFGAWAWLDDGMPAMLDAVIRGVVWGIPVGIAFGLQGRGGFGLAGAPQVLTPRWSRPARLLLALPLFLFPLWIVGPLAFVSLGSLFGSGYFGNSVYFLSYCLPFGSLLLFPVLGFAILRSWATPAADSASATTASTYRADRRTSAIYACTCAAIAGIPVGITLGLAANPVGDAGTRMLLALEWAFACAMLAWLLAWLAAGRVPLVILTQLVLRPSLGRVSFAALLDHALRKQVLRQAGAVYQFRHAALKTHLTALYQDSRDNGSAPHTGLGTAQENGKSPRAGMDDM